MKRPLALLVVFLVLFLLAFEFVPLQVGLGSVAYDLTVEPVFPEGVPKRISYGVVMRRSDADHIAGHSEDELRGWDLVQTADPYQGQSLIVTVHGGDTFSPLGRILSRWQEEGLVLIAHWPDGRRVVTVVDIPDGRVTKHVSVTIP